MSLPDLERIYDAHSQALFAFLLHLTSDDSHTYDLMQELFLKLAANPDLLSAVRDERAFLIRMAHNLVVDAARRRQAHQRKMEGLALEMNSFFSTSDDPDERIFREALTHELGSLPSEQRSVLHLKLWEGMTFGEIATALAISPNTAASRYRYGLDKLREALRPLYEEIK